MFTLFILFRAVIISALIASASSEHDLGERTGKAEPTQIVALHLGDLYAESGQTLQGSFSAVSKPNYVSKY